MRKRKSTITQQYSPTFRKRVSTNYLSLSLPGAYTNIQSPQCQQSNQYLTQQHEHQQKSHNPSNIFSSRAASPNPKYMQRVQTHYNQFILNSKKIHEIIQNVDEVMRVRMQAHEQSLITVIKSQIQKMQEQCKNIIQEYNTMIQNKNKDEEIYYLKNQLDYFRNQALFHFMNGKKIMEENRDLKELVKNKDSIIQDLNQVIKKKTVRLLRQRSLTERMSEKMRKFSDTKGKQFDKQKQKQIQVQTQRQNKQIKENQKQDFLLTKIKKITLQKLPIQDTTLPKNQLRYYAQSTKKYKANGTNGTNLWNSTERSKKQQNTKQLKKKFFWDKNSQKKIIKTNISTQKSQKEQEKNYEQVNGIKIISKLSLKKLEKSKSYWNFENKFSI